MRRAAILAGTLLILAAMHGCATVRSGGSKHPGIQDVNPHAVIRTYPVSATRLAWAMTDVMTRDPILDDVKLMIDPQSNESRPLPHAEREALGLSPMAVTARDVNYNIQAKSKDGQRVGVVIQIKGESDSEVSLLYGVAGDPGLSRAILDEVEVALKGPVKNPGLWKASAAKAESKKSTTR